MKVTPKFLKPNLVVITWLRKWTLCHEFLYQLCFITFTLWSSHEKIPWRMIPLITTSTLRILHNKTTQKFFKLYALFPIQTKTCALRASRKKLIKSTDKIPCDCSRVESLTSRSCPPWYCIAKKYSGFHFKQYCPSNTSKQWKCWFLSCRHLAFFGFKTRFFVKGQFNLVYMTCGLGKIQENQTSCQNLQNVEVCKKNCGRKQRTRLHRDRSLW